MRNGPFHGKPPRGRRQAVGSPVRRFPRACHCHLSPLRAVWRVTTLTLTLTPTLFLTPTTVVSWGGAGGGVDQLPPRLPAPAPSPTRGSCGSTTTPTSPAPSPSVRGTPPWGPRSQIQPVQHSEAQAFPPTAHGSLPQDRHSGEH